MGLRTRSLAVAACGASLVVGACAEDPAEPPVRGAGTPEGGPAPSHAVRGRFSFRDGTEAAGLDAFRQVNGHLDKEFIIESIGGGVALLDYDGDGDLDAYLTNGGSLDGFAPGSEPRDALFANDGTGRFRDVTEEAGLGDTSWTNGVFVADVDADGWPDLYLTNFGPNVLLLNRGDGTFRDVSAEAGVDDASWSTGAVFLDHDRDGDLDLYVANYVDFDLAEMLADHSTMDYRGITVFRGPRGLPAAGDRFFVNDGHGRFEDATERVGVGKPKMFGFQCVAFDYDLDGWVDVFVANDSTPNFLWHNDGEGGFEERGLQHGVALGLFGEEQAGMGVAVGDCDGDAVVDLYVTNFSHDYSTLYRGVEDGFFVDATHRLKLVQDSHLDISWGCGFVDFDNDGVREIFAVNGHIYPQVDDMQAGLTYAQANDLFAFDGRAFARVDGGPGFELLQVSRGAAVGDVDGDGDLDLLVGNIDGPPTLLVNESACGNWIALDVVGRGGNRDAVGARVVARSGKRRQLALVGTGGSFLSSSDRRVHLGLGAARAIDELVVTWPGGDVETFRGLAAGGTVRIEQGRGE